MDRQAATEALSRITAEVRKVIRGKDGIVETAVICLAADGHILIEDAPGVGKTVLAKSLAASIDATFKRVQATPDLLPSDVTGVAVYRQNSGDFEFIPGPVFANILLVDEINRTTPRTQSALLEAMEERQVTAEGATHTVPSPFFVIATQNPLEYHGTYPLPEGQLDRFLASISIGYLPAHEEARVVTEQLIEHPIEKISAVISLSEMEEVQAQARATRIETTVTEYAVSLAASTREHPDVVLGASPRGSLGLVRSAQARALIKGRDYVLPDDVKAVAHMVLAHRLTLKPQAREVGAAGKVIDEVVRGVTVPVST